MLAIALVVWLCENVGVVKESDGAQFVGDGHHGDPADLAYLYNLVVLIVLVVHPLKFLERSQSLPQKLCFELHLFWIHSVVLQLVQLSVTH